MPVTRSRRDSGVDGRRGCGSDRQCRDPAAFAPPLAEVPLPAPERRAVAAAQRRTGTPRPALRFGDRVWTHAELLAEAERFAALFRARLDPDRPPHVGVLLDNTPDYVFALCGAGLAGVAVAGLNHTRVGEHLGRDIVAYGRAVRDHRTAAPGAARCGVGGSICPAASSSRIASPTPTTRRRRGAARAGARRRRWADAPSGGSGRLRGRAGASTPCGRCSSRPGRRRRPRPCAARSTASSPPATGWP